MHEPLPRSRRIAIVGADSSVSETGTRTPTPRTSDKSVSDPEHWFRDVSQALLAPDRGFSLHVVTGVADPRQCARYVSGEVKPPGWLVLRWLRSDHGEAFLNWIMVGVHWWQERQREIAMWRRKADLFDKFMRDAEQLELD